ncbi:hypothetical protein PAAG_07596 [Paracoccidioides lutzii Pb01]|uniref:Uncharacterized protein n=1 Tax=Paracoccidioides lutzii (strain ATCC MYA-826 / Pb01) TaxID=502779 RepID=C1HAE2_PARBA|nr:hypothetical protein PAAG_07596 [Paracoccidioides lutzii Pb01]EEH37315.1 hypothetical protein PAAG_07596 [Paracoccidioides lutzii Pb01]
MSRKACLEQFKAEWYVPYTPASLGYKLHLNLHGIAHANLSIPAPLIEYIDNSFPLKDTSKHASSECWLAIFRTSLNVVNKLGDYEVLYEKLRTRNLCVRRRCLGRGHHRGRVEHEVVMIDFAEARARRTDEELEMCKCAKALADEEAGLEL